MVPFRKKPATWCAYQGCKNNSDDSSMHRFPQCKVRSSLWVEASGNPKLKGISVAKLNSMYRLCGSHFHDWCFMNLKDRRRLVHNAVPDAPKSSVTLWHKKKMELVENVTSGSSVISVPDLSGTVVVTPESSDADTTKNDGKNRTVNVPLQLHDGKILGVSVETDEAGIEEEFEIGTEGNDSLAKTSSLPVTCDPETGIKKTEVSRNEEDKLQSETESSDVGSLSSNISCGSVSNWKRKWSIEQQLLAGQQKLQSTCDNITMYVKRMCTALEETTSVLKKFNQEFKL